MNKLTLSLLCFSLVLFSCKKEGLDKANDHVNAAKIININNNPDFSRVSQGNGFVDFIIENSSSSSKGNRTSSTSSTRLDFKGKINALQINGESLGAIEVAAFGNLFAVSYLKQGEEFSGGIDVFRLNNGVPQLLSTITTPDADITSLTSGGGKFFFGTDLKNFESFNFEAPAAVGIVNIGSGGLNNPQIIPLSGFSVKDLVYHNTNQKLYAATSTRGGLSIISFNNSGLGSRTSFTNYNRLRSLAISGNQIIGTTSTEYRNFDLNDGSLVGNSKLWPIPSNIEEIGRLNILSNGNLVFGNNFSLIYVNPITNELLDEVQVGGWVNSITVSNDDLYIATGNSILVAKIENGKIKILAKAHLYSLFPGINFDVISLKVINNYIVAACGSAGVYVFELNQNSI